MNRWMTVNQSLWWESTGNLACWTLKCGLISLSRTRWQCCRLSNERASSSTADSCMWNVQTIKEHIHIDMRWGKQTSSCCGGVGCIWPLSIHILTEMNFFANFWPMSGFKWKKITLSVTLRTLFTFHVSELLLLRCLTLLQLPQMFQGSQASFNEPRTEFRKII